MDRFADVLELLSTKDAASVSKMSEKQISIVLKYGMRMVEAFGTSTTGNVGSSEVTSTKIGIQGETFFDDVVALMADYNTTDMSKQGKKGDFVMTKGSTRALIEVKNYSSSVPTREIKKFERDISCNKSIDIAMMLSLGSKITGKGSFSIDYIIVGSKKIPIIYVCTNISALVREYVQFMFNLADIKAYKRIGEDGVDLAREHINDISIQMDALSQMIYSFQTMKSDIGRIVDKAVIDVVACENSVRDRLSQVSRVIAEECDEHKAGDDENLTLDDAMCLAKNSPAPSIDAFKLIWNANWDTRTTSKGQLTLSRADPSDSITFKFMKTCINASVKTRGTSLSIKVSANELIVLKTLGVI